MTILRSPGRLVAAMRIVAGICLALSSSTVAHAQAEAVEYYGLDALGSVRVVFDASGNIVGRMDYGPFGQELFPSTGQQQGIYAGLFADGESGLDHAAARSYQVRTGRFSTFDSVYGDSSDPQGWNRYTYALNNPLIFSDPSGLLPGYPCDRREFACPYGPEEYPGGIFGDQDNGRSDRGGPSRRVPPSTPPKVPPTNPPPPSPPKPPPPAPPPPAPPPKGPQPKSTCNSFGRSFPNTFGNRFRDTFWQTNNRVPGVLAPTGVASGYAALRTGGFGAIPRAMRLPGVGDIARSALNVVRERSFTATTTLLETAEWAKIGALTSTLLTGAAFEAGVTAGSLVDAWLFHPYAK